MILICPIEVEEKYPFKKKEGDFARFTLFVITAYIVAYSGVLKIF